MTQLLKSEEFRLSIKLRMKVPKDLKMQRGRLMVGGFLAHVSQVLLCAPMNFICLLFTNKSLLLCCSAHLLIYIYINKFLSDA